MKHHNKLTIEKWSELPKQTQILSVGAEISRAQNWRNLNKKDKIRECMERAMELLDLTIQDKRWDENLGDLFRIREAIGYFYSFESAPIIYKIFLDWLTRFARNN